MMTTFPLLGSLPPSRQQAFLDSLRQTVHADGERLFEEGDPGTEMLLIIAGQVRLSRRTEAGDTLKLATLGSGEVVGEMAVLSPAPRSAAATAVGEVRLAHLSRDVLLERLIVADPAAGALLRSSARLVSERLRHTRAKAMLVRDALAGATPEEVDDRLAIILGAERGDLTDRLQSWLRTG
jgi:NTE family protein